MCCVVVGDQDMKTTQRINEYRDCSICVHSGYDVDGYTCDQEGFEGVNRGTTAKHCPHFKRCIDDA